MVDKSVDQGDSEIAKDAAETSQDEDENVDEPESVASVADDDDDEEDDDENEEDEEEDEEPKLKYARLTSNLGAVYRNADATSAFMVAGDKMVRMVM